MRIYEVIFDHDNSDKRKVATTDNSDAFFEVVEWAKKEAVRIKKELQSQIPKKERDDVDEVEVDKIEYLYHVNHSARLKIRVV
jgi:hypothetical protein